MLPSREFTWKSAKCGPRRDVNTVLNSQVWVLNRLWQAVNICSARRAFALVYAGHAQIVSSDDANNFMTHDFESWRDWSANAPDHEVVTTISFKIRIPRVIVLLVFDRLPKKEVKFTRHNVFERDKNTCQYCGELFDRSELNLDHVVPRDRGGTTTRENEVCSCVGCNTRQLFHRYLGIVCRVLQIHRANDFEIIIKSAAYREHANNDQRDLTLQNCCEKNIELPKNSRRERDPSKRDHPDQHREGEKG